MSQITFGFKSLYHLGSIFFLGFLIHALPGCKCQNSSNESKSNSFSATEGFSDKKKSINLAIWSNYIDEQSLVEFEKMTGYKVNISYYSANEELLAKLQGGAVGYDLAIPSDYMVSAMISLGLLNEIDSAKIPNRSGIEERFLNLHFDPKNQYSLPYNVVTSGIAVNTKYYTEPVTSWNDVFKNPNPKTRVSWLDDSRETPAAALRLLGYSLNTTKPEELEQAKKLLKDAKNA